MLLVDVEKHLAPSFLERDGISAALLQRQPRAIDVFWEGTTITLHILVAIHHAALNLDDEAMTVVVVEDDVHLNGVGAGSHFELQDEVANGRVEVPAQARRLA